MSEFQIYALIGLGLYFLVMILIGIRSSFTETHEGFVIGSRNIGFLPTVASIATSFRDGSGAVFWVGAGLGMAYGGLWIFLGLLTASLFFVFYGEKIRLIAKEHDFITIGEVIRHFLGRYTEKAVTILVLIFSLVAIAMQLYVSGNIFARILGFDSAYGIVSVAAVVGLYMYFGGYSTVVKTDFLQFFIILSLILFPLMVPPAKEDLLNIDSFLHVDPDFGIGLYMLGCFYILSGAEAWQRVFSAKNATVVRYSFPASAFFLLFMTICLIWVGMGTKQWLVGSDPSQALFDLFTVQTTIPTWLLSYFGVVLMAITMSTLDSFCYLFAASLGKNILPARFTDTREKYVVFARVVIIGVLIIMSVAAMKISNVIDVLFSIVSLLYIISPIYVLTAIGVFKKEAWLDKYVAASLFVCAIIYVYMFQNRLLEQMLLTGIPALVMLILLALAAVYQRFIRKPSTVA